MENDSCNWYDLGCFLRWIRDEIQNLAVWIWDGILGGLASVFEALPAPAFLDTLASSTLPSSVAWAAGPLRLDIGFGVVAAAYTTRFIIRRLPVIG